MIKLSVIVPIYNVAQHLERCVVSLMEQTLSEGIEYIFVNDCSTDDSLKVLEATLARYPKRRLQIVIYSLPHNSGLGAARALGIQHARGEYITHCDSDDWVSSDAYQMIVDKIAVTQADIIVSDFIVERIDSDTLITYPDMTISKRLECGLWWMQWSHTVKSSILRNYHLSTIEGINFWEDMDFLMRVYFFAQSISYIHSHLYHYNCSNSQSLTKASSGLSLLPSCQHVIAHLSEFYQGQQVAPPARLLALKLFARDLYLSQSPVDWSAWRALYPESWRYVWMDSQYKLIYRVFYTLATRGVTSFLSMYKRMSYFKENLNHFFLFLAETK